MSARIWQPQYRSLNGTLIPLCNGNMYSHGRYVALAWGSSSSASCSTHPNLAHTLPNMAGTSPAWGSSSLASCSRCSTRRDARRAAPADPNPLTIMGVGVARLPSPYSSSLIGGLLCVAFGGSFICHTGGARPPFTTQRAWASRCCSRGPRRCRGQRWAARAEA
jgi:hypothetical protein